MCKPLLMCRAVVLAAVGVLGAGTLVVGIPGTGILGSFLHQGLLVVSLVTLPLLIHSVTVYHQ